MAPTPLTRRSLLLGALASPFLMAHAQAQGRVGRLPVWVQWNRTRGRSWQTRSVSTVRAYPSQGLLVAFQWKQGPTTPVGLRTYTNVSDTIEQLFRSYEARGVEDLQDNPEAIEDFTWVYGNRLRENIWTSFHKPAETLWEELFARTDAEETPIVPGNGYYLILQPTMDKIPTPEEKPDAVVLDLAGAEAGTPIAKVVESMLAQSLMITLIPAAVAPALPQEILGGTKSVMARITPRPEMAVGAAYLRFIRQTS